MTNKAKKTIDEMLKTVDKGINEYLASAGIGMLLIAEQEPADSDADKYFFESMLAILNKQIDIIKDCMQGVIKMDIVIVVFGVLYLCGFNIGVPLAICSIIEGTLVCILSILRNVQKSREEESKKWDEIFRSQVNQKD